jgi:hypothetical protein
MGPYFRRNDGVERHSRLTYDACMSLLDYYSAINANTDFAGADFAGATVRS